MKALTCVVIGDGTVIYVDIDANKKVAQLKDMMKKMIPSIVYCEASALTLYVAKKDGSWLNADDSDVPKLVNGELPKGIRDMKSAANKMNPAHLVGNAAFDFPDEGGAANENIHVLVVVPNLKITKPAKKAPHAHRLQRWEELNAVLDHHANAKTIHGKRSTGFSYVSYQDVKDVMNATTYDQDHTTIEDKDIDVLYDYLKVVSKVFRRHGKDTEAKQLHFIAPVLVCLCALFNDATLLAEETIEGKRVHGRGRFELVIRRGSKRVCIVEVKKHDLDQGLAQAFVGSEALADVEGMSTVSTVVTTFYEWDLCKITDEKVEVERFDLAADHDMPSRESVKMLVEKLFTMLSAADL